jgi:hypothetical protein
MIKHSGVATRHPEYESKLPLWDKCIDASEGQYAVHAKTTLYLPKLNDEKPDEYNARLKRTPFFNAVWRTISGLKGMIFRKPADAVYPASAQRFVDNVDMAGTPLNLFVQGITEQCLKVGRCGILIDYPSVANAGNLTVAESELLGLRPLMARYDTKAIINWRTKRIAGSEVLTQVVLTEQQSADDSEFGHDTVTVYRVLDLTELGYRQRLFKRTDDKDIQIGDDMYPQMAGRNLSRIPFVFVGVDSLSPAVDSPPLLDLVDMNLAHYMVSADYEHACHFSGLPTLFISGHTQSPEDPSIYIGGTAANCLRDPQAKAYFVETQGDFPALRMNLDDKKAQMAVLGARMLENQKAQVEAAETQKTRQAGEQSQLAAMTEVINVAVTRALQMFMAWAGISGDVSYKLNKDFVPVKMTAQELTALVGSWQAGAISGQTLFYNLKEGEVIADAVDYESEQERINSQGITSV